MLTPKTIFPAFYFTLALVFSTSALAGLYGFGEANPLTQEEKILDMDVPPLNIPNYRRLMRDNIQTLIRYAKAQKPDFQVMLHEGGELLYKSLWEYHLEGYQKARSQGHDVSDPSFLARLNQTVPEAYNPEHNFIPSFYKSIDAVAFNNLYCSPRRLDDFFKNPRLKIAAISQCPSLKAYEKAAALSVADNILFYGFLKPSQAFKHIAGQPVINENARNIFKISDASNISLLLDDSDFSSKDAMIKDIRNSNFDIIVINPLFHGQTPFSPEEVSALRFKKNGARRLILAEQNISEADMSAYYWHDGWEIGSPAWLRRFSFTNAGSLITEYWNPEWQNIISRHFKGIVLSNYDGVFFTGTENHRYFEKMTPLE